MLSFVVYPNFITSFNFLIFYLHVCAHAYVELRDSLQDLVLSFHCMGPRN